MQFLQENTIPKANWADLAGFRKARAVLEQSRAATPEQAKFESTKLIPLRDGTESEIRITRPQSPPAKSPLVVLLFGGGFVVGSNLQLGPYARAIANLYGATAVTLSYRLAPEHKFPTQTNDVWDSLQWLAKNAASIGADPSAGFILGGVSAGANLTAVNAQKALNENLSPPLTGLWFSVPVLFGDGQVPDQYKDLFFSRKQNANAPIFDMNAINRVDEYLEADHKSPDWSPFNVPGAHTGLPPSYFQVCGMDPLRDDGLIYEDVLRQHGVKTRLDVYPGVPHAHFSSVPSLKLSKKAIFDTINNFGWLLGKSASPEEIQKVLTPPAGA